MKKLVFLVSILLLFSKTSMAQQYAIVLKLIQDKEYFQYITSHSTVNQILEGNSFSNTFMSENYMVYRVISVNENDFDLQVNYNKVKIIIQSGDGMLEHSSDSVYEMNTVSDVLGSMIGRPFHLKIAKNGRVIEINDIDENIDSIVNELNNITPSQREEIRIQVLQAFGEDAIIKQWESIMAFMPPGYVEIGDQWQVDMPWNEDTFFNTSCTFKLNDITPHNLIITGEADWVYGEEHKLNGKMKANYKIDLLSGWIIEAVQTYDVNGEIIINHEFGYRKKQIVVPINLISEVKIAGNQ